MKTQTSPTKPATPNAVSSEHAPLVADHGFDVVAVPEVGPSAFMVQPGGATAEIIEKAGVHGLYALIDEAGEVAKDLGPNKSAADYIQSLYERRYVTPTVQALDQLRDKSQNPHGLGVLFEGGAAYAVQQGLQLMARGAEADVAHAEQARHNRLGKVATQAQTRAAAARNKPLVKHLGKVVEASERDAAGFQGTVEHAADEAKQAKSVLDLMKRQHASVS